MRDAAGAGEVEDPLGKVADIRRCRWPRPLPPDAAVSPAAETAPAGVKTFKNLRRFSAGLPCTLPGYDLAGLNSTCEPPLAGAGGGVWVQV